MFGSLQTQKKNKNKKAKETIVIKSDQLDFSTIRKFGTIKIEPPSSKDQFDEKIKDLVELKDALVYWGDIVKRQRLIKFISGTKKLQELEEYVDIKDQEMKYIDSEKQKFLDVNADHEINFEALKLAQQIDKESRVNKIFDPNAMDEEDKEESDEAEQKQAKGKRFNQ